MQLTVKSFVTKYGRLENGAEIGKTQGMEDGGSKKKRYPLGVSRNVFYTGLVSLFMDISSEMVYPLVPLFLTKTLGATKTAVGVIEGIAEATASILKVFSGYLADRFGKKKLLMTAGYATSALSRPVMAAAGAWGEVLTARFVDRVGKGVRTAPRDAIIAESTETGRLGTAFGFHRSMDTVGAVLGPAMAFALLYFFTGSLRVVFYASTIPAVIAVFLIIAFIREKKQVRPHGAKPPALSLASFNGELRGYLAVVGVFSLGNFADAFLILRAEDLGVSSWLIPVVYLAHNIVYAASAAPMGALADRVGLRRMIMAGFAVYSVIYLLVGLSTGAAHIWILFPLYGVYKGMSEGNLRAYLATIAPEHGRATAFGVYHTVAGLALLPASVMAGFLWDNIGPAAPFFYGAATSLAAAVLFAVLRVGRRSNG